MPNPLTNLEASLLCKLGSIVQHCDELLSVDGHEYDRVALDQLLKDHEVQNWIQEMESLALIPKKRG